MLLAIPLMESGKLIKRADMRFMESLRNLRIFLQKQKFYIQELKLLICLNHIQKEEKSVCSEVQVWARRSSSWNLSTILQKNIPVCLFLRELVNAQGKAMI